jgi:hypothetical protein
MPHRVQLVRYFGQLLQVKVGSFGKKPHALLLIPIITSITAKQTFCVEHIVILVHSMVQLQILLKLHMISREGHISKEHSIHRYILLLILKLKIK